MQNNVMIKNNIGKIKVFERFLNLFYQIKFIEIF